VEVPHLGLKGDGLSIDGATAAVRAGAVTVKVPVPALRLVGRGEPGRAPAAARPRESADRARISVPSAARVANELHLIGRTTDEARDLLEKYVDDAFVSGLATIRVVHGKGTGALRRTVHDLLAAHPLVAEHRAGAPHEGGDGATVASLKVD
jgi:DNA mismatch repair protein MutS2